MNPELEALLKSWDACLQAGQGREADGLLERYESELEAISARTKIRVDLLDRAVQRAYQRWQWADDPKFPQALRKAELD